MDANQVNYGAEDEAQFVIIYLCSSTENNSTVCSTYEVDFLYYLCNLLSLVGMAKELQRSFWKISLVKRVKPNALSCIGAWSNYLRLSSLI